MGKSTISMAIFNSSFDITRGYLGLHRDFTPSRYMARSSMLKRNVFLEPKKSTVMDLEREIEDFSGQNG